MGNRSDNMVTPVGRFVSGSITQKQTTGYQNKPIPEEKQMYEFGVAISKQDPGVVPMLQQIAAHAFASYANAPHIQQLIQQMDFGVRGFSWKIADGDKPNKKGQTNPNTVGHWVIYFSSMYIEFCDQNNVDMPAENIKRGSFVMVSFTVATNDAVDDQAGIYVNPQIVKFVAFGDEIRGGISADDAFGDSPIPQQLPAGASLTPVGTAMNTGQVGFQQPAQSPAAGQPHMQPASQPVMNTMSVNTQPMTGSPGNGAPVMGNGVGTVADPSMQPGFAPTQPTTASPSNAQPLTGFAQGQPQPGMPGVQQPGAPVAQPGMQPMTMGQPQQ